MLSLILTIITVLCAIFLIVTVLLQTGKSAGLSGAIGGGAGESFLSKNKAKSFDSKMARLTKWVAVVFMVLSMVICLI